MKDRQSKRGVDRRGFLRAGGAAAAVATAGCATTKGGDGAKTGKDPAAGGEGKVRAYRKLGRTGFEVSDIGHGTGRLTDANVVRYLYDHGLNYFDTAETYGGGDSERKIGEAMPHLDRKKIFIVTKLKIKEADTEQTIRRRFHRCLERLRTDHVDALYSHSVTDLAIVKHAGFHAAVRKLKADGKLKHAGISSHGPRGEKGDSMEQVLLSAVEDGRFDLMLFVYNFMRHEPGAKVLAAANAKNIGTTLMKTAPARLALPRVDPDNLPPEYQGLLERVMKRGVSRDEALTWLRERIARLRREQAAHQDRVDAFVARHGIRSEQQLRKTSILWAKRNPHVDAVLISMPDFDAARTFLPLSGGKLSDAGHRLLKDYAGVLSDAYCRHGCNDCAGSCPHDVPVSTIMRYAYYFSQQRREKDAMQKYAALPGATAAQCLGCPAPCESACPHGLAVPTQLSAAHRLLALA